MKTRINVAKQCTDYVASMPGQSGKFGRGRVPTCAVGDLIAAYPDLFNIEIVVSGYVHVEPPHPIGSVFGPGDVGPGSESERLGMLRAGLKRKGAS